MSIYQDVSATLESQGAKLILSELKRRHRKAYAEYRKCSNIEQLYYLQALQKVIDTAIPEILADLMNRHVDSKTPKNSPEWWRFDKWFTTNSKGE